MKSITELGIHLHRHCSQLRFGSREPKTPLSTTKESERANETRKIPDPHHRRMDLRDSLLRLGPAMKDYLDELVIPAISVVIVGFYFMVWIRLLEYTWMRGL